MVRTNHARHFEERETTCGGNKSRTTEGFSLIFETGEEIASVLQQFSKNQKLAGSSFKAIGALSYAKLGWLNSETNQYDPACVPGEQLELLSLIGDVTLIVLGPPPRRWYHERVLRPTATASSPIRQAFSKSGI
jgi:hypothetical protein